MVTLTDPEMIIYFFSLVLSPALTMALDQGASLSIILSLLSYQP